MLQPIRHYIPAQYTQKRLSRSGEKAPLEVTSTRLRSEVNGLVFPVFFLSKRKGTATIEYRTMRHCGGRTEEALWRVTSHPHYGRPGPFAHRVHRAVEQLITERGLPITNPISFSIHDLCRRMGAGTGGTEYRKIKEALVAIKATQIESKGAFYAKSRSRYIDDIFSLYERVVFAGERLPDGTVTEKTLLWLGSWYLESLNALYVKPLNYRFYLDLHTPISRRLYEVLGVKFYKVAENPRPRIRYRYSTLCKLLPATRRHYRSQVYQQLAPAHRELIAGGFLAGVKIGAIPHTRDWYVTYYPGERAMEEIKAVGRTARK